MQHSANLNYKELIYPYLWGHGNCSLKAPGTSVGLKVAEPNDCLTVL